MLLKADKGLHVQKENYNILLMNIKANKENQEAYGKTNTPITRRFTKWY